MHIEFIEIRPKKKGKKGGDTGGGTWVWMQGQGSRPGRLSRKRIEGSHHVVCKFSGLLKEGGGAVKERKYNWKDGGRKKGWRRR